VKKLFLKIKNMYLFFDTETTGLPQNWRAPITDSDNWPRLVQLAWSCYDQNGNLWESYNFIIKPEGFIIPDEVAKIHRITQDRALNEGVSLDEALEAFSRDVKKADLIIGHNIDFDDKIISAELYRRHKPAILDQANKACTMKMSVDICRLPNKRGNGYKWPNLAELHQFLFQTDFPDAHDAMVDVNACARCFFALKTNHHL
jgi:DNA polymerase III epsilon subunit-like protein